MKRLWALSVVAASAALGGPAWSTAEAQQAAPKKYREAPKLEYAQKEWKSLKTDLLIAGKTDVEAEKKLFTDFYKFAVGELTRASNRESLHKYRDSLQKDLSSLGRAKDSSLHDQLVGMFQTLLPNIFNNSEYSPPARVNCLLLFGALNTKEADQGKGAEPLAVARPVLVGIVNDPKQPDYLRAAVLYGVTRHAENIASADARRDLTSSMVKLLASEPAQGTNKEVHNYFRRRAAEILRVIATKGYEAGMAQAADPLAKLAADEEARLEERCEAIRALGYLDKRNFDERRVGDIARTFTAFAAEVARQTAAPTVAEGEVDAPNDAAPPAANAVAAAAPPKPAAPAADAAAKPPEEKIEGNPQPVLSPDNQAYFLRCVVVGLNGPVGDGGKGRGLAAAAADDASKKLVAGLSTKLGEMDKIILRRKDKSALNDDEIAKLQTAAEELEALLDSGAAVGTGGTAEQARASGPPPARAP